MVTRVHVQNDSHIIVPLRVTRAVTGKPRLDAPDPDDRGWKMATASGFAATEARGPTFGVSVGDTVRLKVERADLDASAPLFATVSESPEPLIEVVEPAGGGPIPADGVVKVRGVADTTAGQALQIRLGSATGPILAEAEAHTFEVRTLLVTPHIVTIHQAATAAAGGGIAPTDQDELNRIFAVARAIWRPAGIHLSVAAAVSHVVVNAPVDDRCFRQVNAGTAALHRVAALGYTAGRCHIYFVWAFEGLLGIGIRRENMVMNLATAGAALNMPNPACVIAMSDSFTVNGGPPVTFNDFSRGYTGAALDHAVGNDVAHEIGHFLTLTHAGDVNGPGRADSYARRQLMHPNNLLPGGARRRDVGYGQTNGQGHRGCLLTLKEHPDAVAKQDGEVKRARARMLDATNLY